MNPLLMTLENTLKSLKVSEYKVIDGNLHIYEDVTWEGKGWGEIPVKIYKIHGNFSIKGNILSNLSTAPRIITGDADFSFNKIDTLEECPEVGGRLNLSRNKITSFKGCCKKVKFLEARDNPLTSVEFAPLSEDYYMNNTKIPDEELSIYYEACFYKTWVSEDSLEDNVVHLCRFDIEIFDKKSWKILEKIRPRLEGQIKGKNYGI